jgi:hypothetical protein
VALKLGTDKTISETFRSGFVRDIPRHVIPSGGVYDAVDFLFDRPGMIYKRGGFSAHSAAMGGNGRTIGIIDPPDRIVCVASDLNAYDVTSENAPQATSLGSMGFYTSENPPLFLGKLIFTDDNVRFPASGITIYPPRKIEWVDPNLTAPIALGGSPPKALRSCIHNSYLVLANGIDPSGIHPNRIWFSPVPNIEDAWDTVNSYTDTSFEITGLASTQGALLVFSAKAIERILGDIPPALNRTNDNLILQPVANIGCSDARSIVHIDSGVVFANPSGVYMTNSAGVQSLTQKADGSGISTYWRRLFPDNVPVGIACGLLGRDHLKVDVFNATTFAPMESLLCYLPAFTWTRISNLCGVSYATGDSVNNTPIDEIYCAQGDRATTLRLSSMLMPSAENKLDPDGKPVLPTLRTRSFEGSPWLKAWGHGGMTMNMPDAYVDDPKLTVNAYKGFGAGVLKRLAVNPVRDTQGYRRQEMILNTDAHTLALDITQQNPSAGTEIITLDIDVREYPTGASRLE